MTEERLIQYMASRKSWMSYETLAKYFCVDRKTIQAVIKKLEREDRVQFKFGENGKKLWHLTEKPEEPPPHSVAVPTVRVHRIADGEDRTAAKRRAPPVAIKKQSWLSVLGE